MKETAKQKADKRRRFVNNFNACDVHIKSIDTIIGRLKAAAIRHDHEGVRSELYTLALEAQHLRHLFDYSLT